MILSAKAHLTALMVEFYHQKYKHMIGIDAVKAKVKESFHVIGLENHLLKIRAACQHCKKKRAEPLTQRIANLPKFRLDKPLLAFAKTGLDFAGPFEIKVGRARQRPTVLF